MLRLESAGAERLLHLILTDEKRLDILEAAEHFQKQALLPDALLAAGFVRNCCWDYLHNLSGTPLNDVDLIYFDPTFTDPAIDKRLQVDIASLCPALNWEIKNQARMSQKHGDPAYTSCIDAMKYWPECETAVGIRIDGSRQLVSTFGFSGLFAGQITPAPHRHRSVCLQRVAEKRWLETWPRLRLVEPRNLS